MAKKNTAMETMTRSLVTIRWNSPMEEANRIMEEQRIRHLPVTDQEGFVSGSLSHRAVNRAMYPSRPGCAPEAVVSDCMSWPAITVDDNATVPDIAEGMIDEKVSAFLVTRSGPEVVGIVTTEDLLRLLLSVLDERKKAGFSIKTLPYTPIVREALREIESAGI
jgi:acetoin utilization protein AcuB